MALIARKKQETYSYIPLIERGEENPFTVKIRRLLPKEFTFIEDKMARINADQTISFTTGTYNWEIAKHGIVGWENLLDENNKPIKPVIGSDGITDDSLNLLPPEVITEIAGVIVAITKDPDNAEMYLGNSSEEEVETEKEATQNEQKKASRK